MSDEDGRTKENTCVTRPMKREMASSSNSRTMGASKSGNAQMRSSGSSDTNSFMTLKKKADRKLARKKASARRKKAIPKKEKSFCRPDQATIQEIAARAVASWLETGRDVRPRVPKSQIEPAVFVVDLEAKIAVGLNERVETLEEGPFIKKTAMRRQLDGLALELLTRLAKTERFQPPAETELRKIAAEASRKKREAERIPDFIRLCHEFSAIYLRYNGGHLEEYLYLALQREVERLKSGPFMRPCDLKERLEAAISMAFVKIASNLRAIADFGQPWGSFSRSGLMAVRYPMHTIEGNQEVFLTLQLNEGTRVGQSYVISLHPSKQFHSTVRHAKDEPPAYCNSPSFLRQ